MSISFYTGKRELTMAEYEALVTLDPNKDYNIIDYPVTTITNAQMVFALTCQRLFPLGSSYVCYDSGTYLEGHTYTIVIENNVKSWKDITGRVVITMQDYEALVSLDQDKEYEIIDYPVNFITNAQMTYALTCKRLFKAGEGFTCSDSGTYLQGVDYIMREDQSGNKYWEAISSQASGTEVIILHPTI